MCISRQAANYKLKQRYCFYRYVTSVLGLAHAEGTQIQFVLHHLIRRTNSKSVFPSAGKSRIISVFPAFPTASGIQVRTGRTVERARVSEAMRQLNALRGNAT